MTELFRSVLFAPGHEEAKMRKALLSDADQVAVDLEDAVPPGEKDRALKTIIRVAKNPTRRFYVRLNTLAADRTYGDMCQLMRAEIKGFIKGFIVPKIETAADCHILNWLVNALEREYSRTGTEIIPVIETAKGFIALNAICAAAGRIKKLSFGSWDFCADTDRIWDASEEAIVTARHQLVTAARAHGLEAPIDTSYPILEDTEGLRRSAAVARKIGFQGKACIHPCQLPDINAGFSPSAEEYDLSLAIVREFRKAEKQGIAAIKVRGNFVDYPIFAGAKRQVDLMKKIRKMNNAKK